MTTAITTSPANTLQKLPYGTASATLNFTTDATAPFTISVTASANANNFTVASNTAMVAGDFYSIEGGGAGGTVPWTINYNGQQNGSTTVCATNLPTVVTAVTNATAYRYERFETRYRATKVTLTNLTNGDVYVWDTTLLDDQAKYTPAGGATTTLANRGILNRSNCVGIHPNLLPANNSFSMKSEYDYRDGFVSDTTAPTLTTPSGTTTGATTATGAVTTNESGGTLYYLVSTSATATAAQVKAGLTKAVVTAGAQSVSLTGLTASTVYYLHFLHADSATPPNESAVADSAGFTTQTAADATAPTLSAATSAPNGAYAATGSVTTNEGNGTLYYLASASASQTVAQVKAGATQAVSSAGTKSVAVSGLAASTIYYLYFVHTDASGNDSTVLRSASFTTAAAPTNPATIDASKVPAGRTMVFPGNKRVVTF